MKYDERFLDSCKKLGINIKRYREENQMTINDLSEKTGIRKEYLQKIEKGQAYGILIEKHLLKIANILKIKISKLLDFEKM